MNECPEHRDWARCAHLGEEWIAAGEFVQGPHGPTGTTAFHSPSRERHERVREEALFEHVEGETFEHIWARLEEFLHG